MGMEEAAPIIFRTVYEYSGPTLWSYAFPGIGGLFFLVSIILMVATRHSAKGMRVFGIVLFLFSLALTTIGIWAIVSMHGGIVKAIGESKIRRVTGTVENFVPMPYEGHQNESFTVDEVPFEYSDYEETGGFNNTVSHGGPIEPGKTVRLTYIPGDRNTIVKVEVPEN